MTDKTDNERNELITQMISDDEGRQRLAHTMAKSDKPFIYKPSPEGSQERAYASYLRSQAKRDPGMAGLYNRMADGWEEQAKLPKWKKTLLDILMKVFG